MSNEIYITWLGRPTGWWKWSGRVFALYNFSANISKLYCFKTNLSTIFMVKLFEYAWWSLLLLYFFSFSFSLSLLLSFFCFSFTQTPCCGPTDESNLFSWRYKNVINAIFICMVLSGCEQRTANYYCVIAPILALFRSCSACPQFPSGIFFI